jgi:hypothetical protein
MMPSIRAFCRSVDTPWVLHKARRALSGFSSTGCAGQLFFGESSVGAGGTPALVADSEKGVSAVLMKILAVGYYSALWSRLDLGERHAGTGQGRS